MSDEDIIFYSQYIFIKHFPVKLEFFFFPLARKLQKLLLDCLSKKLQLFRTFNKIYIFTPTRNSIYKKKYFI